MRQREYIKFELSDFKCRVLVQMKKMATSNETEVVIQISNLLVEMSVLLLDCVLLF